MAAGGATFATFPGVLAGLIVLIYFYYRQAVLRTQMLAQQNPNAIGESNSSVVKRLFSPWLYQFQWLILCCLWYLLSIHLSSLRD